MTKKFRKLLHIFLIILVPNQFQKIRKTEVIPVIFSYLNGGGLGKINARVPCGAARGNDGNKIKKIQEKVILL